MGTDTPGCGTPLCHAFPDSPIPTMPQGCVLRRPARSHLPPLVPGAACPGWGSCWPPASTTSGQIRSGANEQPPPGAKAGKGSPRRGVGFGSPSPGPVGGSCSLQGQVPHTTAPCRRTRPGVVRAVTPLGILLLLLGPPSSAPGTAVPWGTCCWLCPPTATAPARGQLAGDDAGALSLAYDVAHDL